MDRDGDGAEGTAEDEDAAAGDIAGRPVEAAAAAVAAREADVEPADARATLEGVAEDGVVNRRGVYAALAEVATDVSAPEERLEDVRERLAGAREAAPPVAERPVVAPRLEGLAGELAALEDRTDELRSELQELVDRRTDPEAIFEVARGIERLRAGALACERAAEDLLEDVESFERWLESPAARWDALAGDADALADSIEELATTVEGLAAGADDAEDRWLDAAIRQRVLGLVLADLRWEHDRLGEWATEVGEGGERAGAIAARIDDLDARLAEIGNRLSAIRVADWTAAEETLAAVEGELAALEPPIPWEEVEAILGGGA